jgi:hypothetical protein
VPELRLHFRDGGPDRVVVLLPADGLLDLVGAVAGLVEDAAEEGACGVQEAAGDAELVGDVLGEEAVAALVSEELELESLLGGKVLVVLRELDRHGSSSRAR